jgi:hypothetical protein
MLNPKINLVIAQSQAMQILNSVTKMWERAAKGTSHSDALQAIMNKVWNVSNEARWDYVDATGSTASGDLSLSVDLTKSEITKVQIALGFYSMRARDLNGYLSARVYEASKL